MNQRPFIRQFRTFRNRNKHLVKKGATDAVVHPQHPSIMLVRIAMYNMDYVLYYN